MKLDILAIGAHPDDVELSCSGTLLLHSRAGKKTGILDLTRGELGTRGTAEIRLAESKIAAKVLGLAVRETLDMSDGFFEQTSENLMHVIRIIRKYRPEIILCNAVIDRHPDHQRGSELVVRATFLAGLSKIETSDESGKQENWKAKSLYHYIQEKYINPDLIVDVTSTWEDRMKSVLAYRSQFYNPDSKEPSTPISTKDFLSFVEGRAREMGKIIHATYGEGFTVERTVGVRSLFDLA